MSALAGYSNLCEPEVYGNSLFLFGGYSGQAALQQTDCRAGLNPDPENCQRGRARSLDWETA